MTVQTRIQTHALRISSQVLYQLGYLVPVIEPVFTVPHVEIVLKDIFLVIQDKFSCLKVTTIKFRKDHFIYHRTNTHNINNNWMAGYTTDEKQTIAFHG